MGLARITSFSPYNKNAKDYYYAYQKLTDTQNKLVAMQRNPKEINITQYKKLENDKNFWEKQTKKATREAQEEENYLKKLTKQILAQQKSEKNNAINKNNNHNSALGETINYLA